jgi:hypothetical protein
MPPDVAALVAACRPELLLERGLPSILQQTCKAGLVVVINDSKVCSSSHSNAPDKPVEHGLSKPCLV